MNYAFKEKPSFDIELCMQGKHPVLRCHRAANPGSLNLDGCELKIDVNVRGQSWIENKGDFAKLLLIIWMKHCLVERIRYFKRYL